MVRASFMARAVPRGGLSNRGLEIPHGLPPEFTHRSTVIETESCGFTVGRLRGFLHGTAAWPGNQPGIHEILHAAFCFEIRAEIEIEHVLFLPPLEQALSEREITGHRLQHMLPGTRGVGATQYK